MEKYNRPSHFKRRTAPIHYAVLPMPQFSTLESLCAIIMGAIVISIAFYALIIQN